MKLLPVSLLCLLFTGTLFAGDISLKTGDGRVTVNIDGKLFTEYLYEGWHKPVLYPVMGPNGEHMVRHFPFKKGVEGEAADHPHHAGIWYTHGDVNGISFWHVGKDTGDIVQESMKLEGNTIRTENLWKASDGKVQCSDTRVVAFSTFDNGGRAIDYTVTLRATHGDVTFGDTKEGSMGIRTHPVLRVSGKVAKGKARNDAGDKDKALWGKNAKWVDYHAPIRDGQTVGVAIFDHPTNFRHPTTWHARDYGLIAANPYGLRHFKGAKGGAGKMVVKSGEEKTFRYRFVFHRGNTEEADVAGMYAAWAK